MSSNCEFEQFMRMEYSKHLMRLSDGVIKDSLLDIIAFENDLETMCIIGKLGVVQPNTIVYIQF